MAGKRRAFLQFAASETDADILYGSGFAATDAFVLIEHRGRSVLAALDFECGRARKESRVHEVWPFSELAAEDARRRRGAVDMSPLCLVAAALRRLGLRGADVPERFPLGLAEKLRAAGFALRVRPGAPYPRRLIKSAAEIRAISEVQRTVEKAMAAAAAMLRRSRVAGDRLVLAGKTLVAEDLHRVINLTLVEHGCHSSQTIVAPGDQAVDPHNQGRGPLRPGQPTVIDIFPRSGRSHYFADMTRTLVRGRPSARLRAQYQAVLRAQRLGISLIKPGVAVRTVHAAVARSFAESGFATGEKNGRLQGFTHSTGHGLGLDIHEPPRVGMVPSSVRFRKGMVVTVEPGLYYLGTGGVRIEDMVLVTGSGTRNLTRYPKKLSP